MGAVVGVLLGFVAVKKLIALLPFAIVCLFAGLMIGAFPAVAAEIKGAEKTTKRIVLFVLGLCIPIAVGCVSALMAREQKAAMLLRMYSFGSRLRRC